MLVEPNKEWTKNCRIPRRVPRRDVQASLNESASAFHPWEKSFERLHLLFICRLSRILHATWGSGAHFAALVCSNRGLQMHSCRLCPPLPRRAGASHCSCQGTRTKSQILYHSAVLLQTRCRCPSLIMRSKRWDCQAMSSTTPWLCFTAPCNKHSMGRACYR